MSPRLLGVSPHQPQPMRTRLRLRNIEQLVPSVPDSTAHDQRATLASKGQGRLSRPLHHTQNLRCDGVLAIGHPMTQGREMSS